jgi:hypothetical protein
MSVRIVRIGKKLIKWDNGGITILGGEWQFGAIPHLKFKIFS